MFLRKFLPALLLLLSLQSYGQSGSSGLFLCGHECGNKALSSPITVEELKNCDLVITCKDTNYYIYSFNLSFMPRDTTEDFLSFPITGNKIPEKYRQLLLTDERDIALEFIKARLKREEPDFYAISACRIKVDHGTKKP